MIGKIFKSLYNKPSLHQLSKHKKLRNYVRNVTFEKETLFYPTFKSKKERFDVKFHDNIFYFKQRPRVRFKLAVQNLISGGFGSNLMYAYFYGGNLLVYIWNVIYYLFKPRSSNLFAHFNHTKTARFSRLKQQSYKYNFFNDWIERRAYDFLNSHEYEIEIVVQDSLIQSESSRPTLLIDSFSSEFAPADQLDAACFIILLLRLTWDLQFRHLKLHCLMYLLFICYIGSVDSG